MNTNPISHPKNLRLAMAMLLLTSSAGALAQEIDAPVEKIYSCVRGQTTASQAVIIRNTGTSPLQITGLAKTGANTAEFTLVSPPSMPQTIGAGGSLTVNVNFKPGTLVGALSAALRITSNDADEGIVNVGLYGLSARAEQGNNEPTLHNICLTLGYKINVGSTNLLLGTGPAPIGQEVIQPLFVKAGTGVVTMTPVARYSPDDLLDFGYYTKSGSTPVRVKVATIKLDQEQKLNPLLTTSAAPTFDPGTAVFGFYAGPAPAYANYNIYSEDSLNKSPVPLPHSVRIYPLRNRAGQPVPNSYLVCMEPAKNGDYQDYVFVVSNIKPLVANGTYKLTASHSGKALDVPGATLTNVGLQQWTYTGGQNQRWQVTAVSGGYYKIIAAHSSKALTVPGASTANVRTEQQTYTGADNQLWKFEAVGGNSRIVARHSG
ncbi:MAG: RICIN domain-containing protein, partial [Akkermansiaceae bacterium]|nr:RICIN domain-containing protein [Verrucomicrobiales bacterium]